MKKIILYSLFSLLFLQVQSVNAESDLERIGREFKKIVERLEKSKYMDQYFQTLIQTTEIKVIADEVVKRNQLTETRHIVLTVPGIKNFGEIHLMKRTPILAKPTALPTSILLSGAFTGMNAIDLVPPTPNASVVTLDYGFKEMPKAEDAFATVSKLWGIQAKFIIAYVWLMRQKNVNPFRLSSINISFGNFIAPYPLKILNAAGIAPNATVFAFGGSSLMPFFQEGLREELTPKGLEILNEFLAPVVNFLEPTRHLPYLEGPFLVVRATDENIIPEASFQSLLHNLPEPKELVELKGQHINVDQIKMIDESVRVIFEWLKKQPQSAPF